MEHLAVLVAGFVVIGVAGALAAGVALGWLWLSRKSQALSAQDAEVQARWQALAAASRLNGAFWDARTAMRDEAMRHAAHRTVDGEWREQ